MSELENQFNEKSQEVLEEAAGTEAGESTTETKDVENAGSATESTQEQQSTTEAAGSSDSEGDQPPVI